jgi:hypothetical protein
MNSQLRSCVHSLLHRDSVESNIEFFKRTRLIAGFYFRQGSSWCKFTSAISLAPNPRVRSYSFLACGGLSMLDRTLPGIQNLKHVVVLMMENRSFDHMLGALHSDNPAVDGPRPSLPRRRPADIWRSHYSPESRAAAEYEGLRSELLQPAAQRWPLSRDHELLHRRQASCAQHSGKAIRRLQPLVLFHPRP